MNEKHVTSLELSKKLKELGVKQESEFYWSKEGSVFNPINPKYNMHVLCSAFLASELGEILPENFGDGEYLYDIHFAKVLKKWYATGHDTTKKHYIHFTADTDANARAKMLIYLIEQKLFTLPSFP